MTTAANSLFAAISSAAESTAHAVAAELATQAEFFNYSANTQPTDGFVLPVAPLTISPYGYQTAAVETILKFRKAVLGFAPGMGKTVVAQCVIAAAVAEGGRALVVVPPSLRIDPWVREFAKEFPHLRVELVEGRTEQAFSSTADVVIIGHSVLTYRMADIQAWDPTVLVADEGQDFKSRQAKRAKALRDLGDDIEVRHGANMIKLIMTGTLATIRPDDVYMPTRITGISVSKGLAGAESYKAFQNRWCYTELVHTPHGDVAKTVGCVDAAELNQRLMQTCYIRVEREDVLDMPDKVWTVRSLSLNGELRHYRKMEQNFIQWVAETRGDEAARRANRAEAVTKLMALWKEAGKAKAVATAEYVAQLVQQGEQVVVMGWHVEPIAMLNHELTKFDVGGAPIRVAEFVGGMTSQQKADEIDSFRSGDSQVLIANIRSGGTGLNLDTAAHLVFFQLPWSPGMLAQASDRIYRVTQKRDCTIHVVNALGTVEERMFFTLHNKAQVIDMINAGKTGLTMDTSSVEDDVLADYGF